ncbi:Mobile element protein [Richelia intracellularis]|nr:Mobile element protein [Richelia intracellularis]
MITESIYGVAESGDDFTKFSRIYQWFQTLIHPLIQQRQKNHDLVARYGGEEFTVILSNTPGSGVQKVASGM